MTPVGQKRVDQLKINDEVLLFDLKSFTAHPQQVTGVYKASVSIILELRLKKISIRCTAEHPFLVENIGWVPLGKLQIGSKLRAGKGDIISIDSIKAVKGEFQVFNIEVSGSHTYFVSEHHVIVHNKAMELVIPICHL